MKTTKIVLTGGPSTGKTTVIEELEARGITCLHEVIRSMTLDKKETETTTTFKTNPIVSVANPKSFNQLILDARIAQFNEANDLSLEMVFLDRGIPDVLAYMDCFNQEYNNEYISSCNKHRYDFVFIMPPWKEIHVCDNERFESFEESLRINECLQNTYTRLGYNLITVPEDSIKNRSDFILNYLKNRK